MERGLRGGCYAIVDPVYQALKSERAPRNLVNLEKMWRLLEARGHFEVSILVEVSQANDLILERPEFLVHQDIDAPISSLIPVG